MIILQQSVHYFLHFIFPIFIAYIFFKKRWKKVYIMMLLTMLVDLDHLLANPVFDSCRCSIGFHPLHSYVAMLIYLIMSFIPFSRVIGIGLLLHVLADYIDCLFIAANC